MAWPIASKCSACPTQCFTPSRPSRPRTSQSRALEGPRSDQGQDLTHACLVGGWGWMIGKGVCVRMRVRVRARGAFQWSRLPTRVRQQGSPAHGVSMEPVRGWNLFGISLAPRCHLYGDAAEPFWILDGASSSFSTCV